MEHDLIDLDLDPAAYISPLPLPVSLPMPNGRPIPCFFGRRFLTAQELIATGLVPNTMTLWRLIRQGRFPRPLAVGERLRRWDVLELQALIDELAVARQQHEGGET